MNENKININWYPGHMAKTKRDIINDLKLIDIVIEILDARIPLSSRNPDIEKIIQNKKRIVVLNKFDLADEKETQKWIDYFKNQGIIALKIDSNSGKGIDKVTKVIEDLMVQELDRKREKGIIRKTVRVMILGIPNVGKSSFINRISKKTTMAVGNRPGVTRQKQWIRIGKQIELLDTPGVLWPKFESQEVGLNLAFTGSIKDEIMDKVDLAYNLLKILEKKYTDNLLERYKLTREDIENCKKSDNYILELMYIIGKKRGALKSGGIVDEEKVANIILDDFRSGRMGKITLEVV